MHHHVSNRLRVAALLIAAALPLDPAHAQHGALVFKHFRTYPSGQWLKELTGTRNNVSMGPPQSMTSCASPLDARAASAATRTGNAAASNCTMKVLKDEETTLEFEQVCPMGSTQQVMHVNVRAIDDKTMTMETRMNLAGMGETVTKIKSTYQGPCKTPDATAAAPMPAGPKVDCAELAELRQNIQAGVAQCAQLPAANRAQCDARLDMGRRALASQDGQCK